MFKKSRSIHLLEWVFRKKGPPADIIIESIGVGLNCPSLAGGYSFSHFSAGIHILASVLSYSQSSYIDCHYVKRLHW